MVGIDDLFDVLEIAAYRSGKENEFVAAVNGSVPPIDTFDGVDLDTGGAFLADDGVGDGLGDLCVRHRDFDKNRFLGHSDISFFLGQAGGWLDCSRISRA